MSATYRIRGGLLAFCVLLLALSAAVQAQPAKEEYQPEVGQQGKDVVWVPTPQALVDRILDMGKVTPKDYVIDLGSGDGRTVITAAKRGARALGIEYNPDMVELSRRNAAKEGVGDKTSFVKVSRRILPAFTSPTARRSSPNSRLSAHTCSWFSRSEKPRMTSRRSSGSSGMTG